MPYRLKLILISYQGIAIFTQKQILRSTSPKNLQKQNNDEFFIYAPLRLTTNKFSAPMSIEDILDQLMFLNQHKKLDLSSDI